ncbi:MAG TPA: MnhB domain-containing protein [Candidatus Methanomethylicus sp.]|nr:MnhB domain-containing protein [Candidatus Methanomethylicus sp.]
MESNALKGSRGIIAVIALMIIFVGVSTSLLQLNGNVARGISPEYNVLAPYEAPNNLASWVYDYRGFDTLIETGVIYVGALVSVLAIGRGIVRTKGVAEEAPVAQSSMDFHVTSLNVILKYFGIPVIILIVAYSLLVLTGASTSGGGGFQCGVIFSSAFLLGMIFYGKKNPLNLSKKFLIGIGGFGWALYALLGLPGYLVTGYWQYNVGTDLWSSGLVSGVSGMSAVVPDIMRQIFGDPFRILLVLSDGTYASTSGIVPLINIGEAFNVIGAIGLIFLVFAYGYTDEEGKSK